MLPAALASTHHTCNLSPTPAVLLYNLSQTQLYFYTQAELDLMRLSKSVYSIPVPVLRRKIDIYLPEQKGSEGWFEVGRLKQGEVERYLSTIWLPRSIVLGRLMGRWEVIWVVE